MNDMESYIRFVEIGRDRVSQSLDFYPAVADNFTEVVITKPARFCEGTEKRYRLDKFCPVFFR